MLWECDDDTAFLPEDDPALDSSSPFDFFFGGWDASSVNTSAKMSGYLTNFSFHLS